MPVGVLAFILTPFLLGESRDARAKSFDALGAILVTGGLSLLVLGITQGHGWGWDSARTIGTFIASAVLLVGFVVWEQRAEDPLMRFGILRARTVLGSNIAGFILGTALFAMFLMLTLYMQQVLHYSPMKTGVGVPRGRRYVDHLGERRRGGGQQGGHQAVDRGRDAVPRGRHGALRPGAGGRLLLDAICSRAS